MRSRDNLRFFISFLLILSFTVPCLVLSFFSVQNYFFLERESQSLKINSLKLEVLNTIVNYKLAAQNAAISLCDDTPSGLIFCGIIENGLLTKKKLFHASQSLEDKILAHEFLDSKSDWAVDFNTSYFEKFNLFSFLIKGKHVIVVFDNLHLHERLNNIHSKYNVSENESFAIFDESHNLVFAKDHKYYHHLLSEKSVGRDEDNYVGLGESNLRLYFENYKAVSSQKTARQIILVVCASLFVILLGSMTILIIYSRFINPLEVIINILSRNVNNLKNGELKFELIPKLDLSNESRELSLVGANINKLLNGILQRESEIKVLEKNKAIGDLSKQVAHDIKSPLAALKIIVSESFKLPEAQRKIVINATKRIEDIASDLLDMHKNKQESNPSKHLLLGLVESVISEKRVQYQVNIIDIDLYDEKNKGLFISVCGKSFSRVFSNILNNSIDSFKGKKGVVKVLVKSMESSVLISIKDNGCGISSGVIDDIFKEGASFGKANGVGLGLFHAKKCIESWNGSIEVVSHESKGTEVKIMLPYTPPPEWFSQKIYLSQNSQVICLDDDKSIYDLWRNVFYKTRIPNRKIFLKNEAELDSYINTYGIDNKLFFIDEDLKGSDLLGSEIIKKYGIESKSILVTSKNCDDKLTTNCLKWGIKILPKDYVQYTTFTFDPAVTHLN